MAKSAKTLFLDNLELVYENDALWLEFRRAVGSCMETRLWDERLFRRLERERLRLRDAVVKGEVVLPQKLYRLMSEKLKETPVPNESRVKEGKSFSQN
ncbi:MAG: hypothetical protein Q4E34_05910 [Synergistaceae bacterium]|nr:hypothetical protein [Synergistaceae bacterium]